MKPLPETREALAEFVSSASPDLEELLNIWERLPGASCRSHWPLFGPYQRAATFTLVASDSEIATLDAAQYLDGGPCVEVGEGDPDIEQFSAGDPLDEDRWHLFAAATAAHGVASTLSLPVYAKGKLIGGVNLYAAAPDAFAGRIHQLAAMVGAAPTQAIRDADLSFSTSLAAAACFSSCATKPSSTRRSA